MKILAVALLLCVGLVMGRPVELLEQEVGQKIFHEDPDYVIFVSTQAVEPVATFKEYCEDAKHGCAYIIPEVEEFELFYKFMGIPQHEYYIIVNALERKKYVLSKPPTIQNFKQFFKQYTAKTLEPYYASDPIPQMQDGVVDELVGLTIKQFVEEPGRIAAVFFYAEASLCQECIDLLSEYQKLAMKLRSPTFAFGRINRVTNEHPSIQQQNVPVVVVYFPNGKQQIIEKFDAAELQYKLMQLKAGDDSNSKVDREAASQL